MFGNNNIQVSGDFIKTEKIIRKTEVIYDPNVHITNAQAKEIQDRIKKLAEPNSSYAQKYSALTKKYKVPSYKLLHRDQYEDAIKWLDKQIAASRPKLMRVNPEQARKDFYKSLNARANQLGINIHEYATKALELKEPLLSLKDLSDTRLKKLYVKLFSIKK